MQIGQQARRLGWVGLGLLVAGVLVAIVDGGPAGIVLGVAGGVLFVAMQYVRGRYGD